LLLQCKVSGYFSIVQVFSRKSRNFAPVMKPQSIKISNFFYNLPDEKIAKHPLSQRDMCKLLVADKNGVKCEKLFRDLPEFLPQDAMLIYNNTRVINARLRFRKVSGAVIEVFCLEPVAPADYERNFAATDKVSWRCFVGNSKRWKQDALQGVLNIDGNEVILTAQRTEQLQGASIVEFSWNNPRYTFARVIEAAGVIPIPPYLNRETEAVDSEDYQTVFSKIEGSVAAPTAGLHFTPEVLAAIDERGIARREVTLHVGAGTFQPVKSEEIGDHDMHSEFIVVDLALIDELAQAAKPVYAVGTTSVRTLESVYHAGCLMAQGRWDGEVPQWYPYEDAHPNLSLSEAMATVAAYVREHGETKFVASTRIIIAPGYKYRVIKGMVTNFHQPGSTLLLLVSALIGDVWRDIYDYALSHNFRFLSYGDACLFTCS
jgi:S-adenosylmethionine:tRNA ribosyltransferase-isomerase